MNKNNTAKIKTIELPQFYEIGNKHIEKDDIIVDHTKKQSTGFLQSIIDIFTLGNKKGRKERTQSEYVHLQRKLSANILKIEEIKLKEKEMLEYNRIDIEELSRQNESLQYKLDILKDKIVKEDEDLNRFEKKLFKSRNK